MNLVYNKKGNIMKKIMLLTVLVLSLLGCTSEIDKLSSSNRQNLTKLNIGMTRHNVMQLMGSESAELQWSFLDPHPYPSASNPYRVETLQGKDKVFEILYYCTDLKRNDGAVTDDELTPFVFERDKLIGWGWNFMEANIQKYEIIIR